MKIILFITLILTSNITFANQNNNEISNISSLLMFGGLFALMYFLLIRPQTKKAKEHKTLIENLKINNEIVTTGGLLGKITKITEQFVIITIADKVEIIVQKEAITHTLPKGTIKELI